MDGVITAWLCFTIHTVPTSNEGFLLAPVFFQVVDLCSLQANQYNGVAAQWLWLYSKKCGKCLLWHKFSNLLSNSNSLQRKIKDLWYHSAASKTA